MAEMAGSHRAILLPGAAPPAELDYADLIAALGDEAEVVAKDLELFAGDAPPPDYSLETEIDGILRTAEQAGFERFHLVGYSAGGASSIAFAARHPERLLSLALMEPGWVGNQGLGPEEEALWREFDRIMALPPAERISEFVRVQLREGVDPPPPPPGPPPPWMASRPAGLAALTAAFKVHDLDEQRLRSFDRPVYYTHGALSNPDYHPRQAERLAAIFPDFTLEVYDGRHHFDPPHRAEPDRVAHALINLWFRAAT